MFILKVWLKYLILVLLLNPVRASPALVRLEEQYVEDSYGTTLPCSSYSPSGVSQIITCCVHHRGPFPNRTYNHALLCQHHSPLVLAPPPASAVPLAAAGDGLEVQSVGFFFSLLMLFSA